MSFLKRVTILTLQCLWFLTVAIPIMMYFERPPVSTYRVREIEKPIVAPGETLKIKIAATLSKDCPGSVIRIITDSTGKPVEFAEEPRPEFETYTVLLVVPLGSFPGPAKYGARVFWRCNWIQEWFPREVSQPPIPFEITPVDGQLPLPGQQGIYQAPITKSEFARLPQ